MHTARALSERAAQPIPVQGKSLCDATLGGATLELLDGKDCLPTSLRTGSGLFTAAAFGCGAVGSKTKRSELFLASVTHRGGTGGVSGLNTFGSGHIVVTISMAILCLIFHTREGRTLQFCDFRCRISDFKKFGDLVCCGSDFNLSMLFPSDIDYS